MSLEESEWRLIVARLSGSGTEEDNRKLAEWLNASEQHEIIYEEAEKIWEASGKKLSLADPRTDQEWKKLHKRIADQGKVRAISTWYYWMAAAASILLFLAYGIYYRSGTEVEATVLMDQSIIASNEVKTFYLPDSSKIWLNVQSEIGYMNSFGKTDRSINLTGEAYFKVKKDPSQPFIIHTKNGAVTVVGTAFDVKEDSLLTVVVEEGIVKVNATSADEQSVQLVKGERAEVTEDGIKQMENKDLLFASWRKKNNPLYTKEVAQPLTFLKQKYTWKENNLNQTVVDGFVTSTASLATYERVMLRISYQKPNGKIITTLLSLDQPVHPGQKVYYHKKLLDFFVKNPVIQVEFESIKTF